MLSFLLSPEGLVTVLIGGLVLELTVMLVSHWDYLFKVFGSEERHIREEVRDHNSRALNFTALTFAILSLVLTEPLDMQVSGDITLVLLTSFTLFIIAYKMGVYAATRRVIWYGKRLLFNYGVLGIVFGMFLLFHSASPQHSPITGVMVLAIVIIHVKYVWDEYWQTYRMKYCREMRTYLEKNTTTTVRTILDKVNVPEKYALEKLGEWQEMGRINAEEPITTSMIRTGKDIDVGYDDS